MFARAYFFFRFFYCGGIHQQKQKSEVVEELKRKWANPRSFSVNHVCIISRSKDPKGPFQYKYLIALGPIPDGKEEDGITTVEMTRPQTTTDAAKVLCTSITRVFIITLW